ncbi:MAG TPA: TM1266 family iron-only hydrogenase system putative regulator [Terriglobales bacterium]|nr:TM1266 family iron-only hydrogenase system putative regulator [Terriglobales bacterium]
MTFTVEHGSFSYGQKPIIDDLSLALASGDLLAILGPNGAGKTTLLRCMMGHLKWKAGASYLDGEQVLGMPPRKLWSRMAYVPQARGAFAGQTVEELVLLGRSSHMGLFAKPGKADRSAAAAALERLGLEGLAGRPCRELSGGELQMVLIARAIAAGPELLILDEPESGLDFKNQLVVLDTLSDLAAEGMACIFNTHYPAHALQRATKALLLWKGGRLFGQTSRVLTEETLAAAFGVRAAIGELETPHKLLRTVMPVEILTDEPQSLTIKQEEDLTVETRIAIIAIIVEDRGAADRINALLSEYGNYIIGRMGLPYPKKELSLISVAIDAPEEVIAALSGKLGMVRGISVKTTYSKR